MSSIDGSYCSVTTCWNKKLPKIFQTMPKKEPLQFLTYKVMLFTVA